MIRYNQLPIDSHIHEHYNQIVKVRENKKVLDYKNKRDSRKEKRLLEAYNNKKFGFITFAND